MGSTIFYVPDDLMSELKQVGNRSALITELLREYFNKAKPLEELRQTKLKESQTLIQEAEILDKEIKQEKEQLLKQEQEAKKLTEAEDKEKEAERKQKQRNTFKDIFLKNWETSKEEVESLLDEFFKLIKEEKIVNVLGFMELKQIKRKEKKNA